MVFTKTMILEYTEAKLAMCSFTDASTSWTIGVPADDRALSVLVYISLERIRCVICKTHDSLLKMLPPLGLRTMKSLYQRCGFPASSSSSLKCDDTVSCDGSPLDDFILDPFSELAGVDGSEIA